MRVPAVTEAFKNFWEGIFQSFEQAGFFSSTLKYTYIYVTLTFCRVLIVIFLTGTMSGGGGGGFFPRARGFWENVRQFSPRLRFLFVCSGDWLAHTNSTV